MAITKDFITRYGVLVQGNSAVSSSTGQTNALQVNGGASIAKNLIVGTTTELFGPLTARSNATLLGPTTVDNLFTVTNAASFLNNVSISGNLLVLGITTLSNVLNVTGPTTFTNTATFSNGLISNGPSIFNGPLTLNGGGSVSLGTSSLTLSGDLTVGGIGSFNSSTAAASGGIGALVVPTGGLYVGNNLYIAGTSFNTGTNTSNALYLAGGAWIDKTLVVEGTALFKGDVTFNGTATYVYSTNTVYTDNIINLHVPPDGVNGAWTLDDGKDIGFIFHNYKGADNDSFLGWANDTGYLEWYGNGLETAGGTFTNAVYGIFKTGGIRLTNTETAVSIASGALQIQGGIGANNIWTTNDISGGTVTARNLTQGRIVFAGVGGQLTDDGELTYDSLTNLLSADVSKATTATNIAGGGPGMIPYQSSYGITAFVNTGTTGYVLQSNGTNAPSWTPLGDIVAGNANTATNIAGGTANQIVIQTAPGTTGFVGPGNAGQFLRSNGTGSAPSFVNTGNIYIGNAVFADNLRGPANGIPYQSNTDTTGFITPGVAGSLLQSNGTTATFVSTSTLLVGFATNASTADKWTTARTITLAGDLNGSVTIDGSQNYTFTATVIASGASTTATNLAGGTTGAIPYQSTANVTTFLSLSGTENAILAAGTTSPKYVTQIEAKSGSGSSTTSVTQSLRITAGGIGVTGDSYFADSLGIASNLKINGNINSSNTTSGSLQVIGGAGIGGNLYIGGKIVVNDDTDSNNTAQGSIVTAGGLGVAKDIVVGGDITIGATANSTVIPAIYSNNVILASYTSPSISSTGTVNLDQYSQTTYRTARYTVQIVDGSSIHVTEIVVTHNGTDAYINEYGIITNNGELGTFNATANGTNVILTFTPTIVTSMSIKVVRFGITA
jgi:hypothetical protein